MPPPDAAVSAGWLARARAASDRVPTRWFASIGAALFLAITAGFGGLASVADEVAPLERLAAGQTHTSAQLSITVQRAVLIDALPGSGAFPDEKKGERLLVLLIELENEWDQPLWTAGVQGAHVAVRLENDERDAVGLVREDDQTALAWLQPDVPAVFAFSWTVAPSVYAAGDELHVVLRDSVLEAGQLLYTDERWISPTPAAIVTVPIEDVGAGADAAQ